MEYWSSHLTWTQQSLIITELSYHNKQDIQNNIAIRSNSTVFLSASIHNPLK